MKPIEIIIADDHAGVRNGIRSILHHVSDIRVVGEASDGKAALDLVEQLSPDILLLDMEMPVLDGTGVIKRLSEEDHPVNVLVLSTYTDRAYIRAALEHGASGYLIKDEAPLKLIETIRKVAQGQEGLYSRKVENTLDQLQGGKSADH